MGLSADLIGQFVKLTKPAAQPSTPRTVNGTVRNVTDDDGNVSSIMVLIDGSSQPIPVESMVEVRDGERVSVQISNHTATIVGNLSTPAARTESVTEVKNEVKDVEKEVKDELNVVREEVTTTLKIESSRGTVFKNNSISTVLSVVIYRGSTRITNIDELHSEMPNASLRWKWRLLDDSTFGDISADDEMIRDDGFTLAVSSDKVNTKVTFMCELIEGEENGNKIS